MHIPTQEIICKALEELLQSSSMDKITVRMVCEKAGISRQALYNHYYSLIAVLEDMITRQMKQALGEQNANLTWESGFERILSCMREHKMMLLHVQKPERAAWHLRALRQHGGQPCHRSMRFRYGDQRVGSGSGVYHAHVCVCFHRRNQPLDGV